MPGLKKHHADFTYSANKATPDELDQRYRYSVMYPSISATGLGTCEATGATPQAVVFTNTKTDYPRNILLRVLGVAGGQGGTLTINGTDQFGRTIQESMGLGSAAGGGTVAGTKIFDTVTTGTFTPVGLGGTAVGTVSVGYASGTAAGIAHLFGLPVKIKATSDVKRITWIDNGTSTALSGGTISTLVGTANHTFAGTKVVAATDIFVVDVLSTYDSWNDTNVA